MFRDSICSLSPAGRALVTVLLFVAVLSSDSCEEKKVEPLGKGVTVFGVKLPSGYIFLMEDPGHPALQRLRYSEGIDELLTSGGDEYEGLAALAKWTAEQFESSLPFPNYPPWDAERTLDMVRSGETGGFCAQYAIIFGQAAQSLGYAIRYVDLMSQDRMKTHFTTEVFLPTRKIWAAFEPQYGYGYVDSNGEPLGVLALHEFSRGLREGKVFRAPHREKVSADRLSLFHHFRMHLRNNFLTVPVRYRVRRVSEGLQWLFEPYQLIWAGAMGEGYIPGLLETVQPDDFLLPMEPWEVASPVRVDVAEELINHFERTPAGRLYVFDLPLAELDRLVDRYFVADEAFRPLSTMAGEPSVPRQP